MVGQDQPVADDHDLTVWAAHTAGHHLGLLREWESRIWSCRQLFEEGRIRAEEKLPDELGEVAEALDLLAPELRLGERKAHRLGAWMAGCVATTREMLRGLPAHRRDGCDIDWGQDLPPGGREWAAIYRTVQDALAGHPHLRGWFRLGERLAELRQECWRRMPVDAAAEVCGALRALRAEGRYAFLSPAIDVLNARDLPAALPGDVREIVDPGRRAVTVPRLEAYVRDCLRRGARPAPLIALKADALDWFGAAFRAADFRKAEWRILCLLCRNPRKDVARDDIIRYAGLDCAPRNLAPHIARLRRKLRPAVRAYYAGMPLPEHADACFIVAVDDEPDGPYWLEVDRKLVSADPPSPSGNARPRPDGS